MGDGLMFTLIRNAHVFAPEDLGQKDLLICNDRIIAVEDHIDFAWDPAETEEINAAGKYLVPGFIDQHVHIIGGGGEDGFASLIPELQMTDCVRYGVTTVVGLLGTDGTAKSVRALVAKTKALKEQGMSAYCLTGSYAYPPVTVTGSVAGDIAFIDEVLGVKIAISDHRSSNISVDELAYLATQARTAGLLAGKPGIVHMHTGRGKKGLSDVIRIVEETDIPVSQFRPTHCGNQYEDAVKFAHMGGYIDFTSGPETAQNAAVLSKALHEVPVKQVTLSSDSNGSFPKWSEDKKIIGMGIGRTETLYATIRHLIKDASLDVNMSDALSLITSNVAEGLGLYPRKGAVRKGSDADLVMLDQNLNVTDVMARGAFMMRSGEVCAKNYYDDIR